ncbi:MAG: WD40 repeat domain-containing protein [Candidatus Eisenbacteria bacterium]
MDRKSCPPASGMVEAFATPTPPGRSEPRLLCGAAAPVRRIAISPCGRYVAAGLETGSLRLFDLRVESSRMVLEGHVQRIEALAFEDQGVLLASASADGTVRFWDHRSGRCCRILQAHPFPVTAMALTASADRLATGDGDGTIKVWDTQPSKVRLVLKGCEDGVAGLAFDPGGKLLYAGDGKGTVRSFALPGGRLLAEYAAMHRGPILAWAVASDRERFATAGRDGRIRLWTTRDGRCAQTLSIGSRPVLALALSARPARVAVVDSAGRLACLDATASPPARLFSGQLPPPRDASAIGLVFDHASGRIGSGGPDRGVRLWDPRAASGTARATASANAGATVGD